MDTIIYRNSDKLIAGYVFPRRTEQQTQEAVATEIKNICQSELGGVTADYTTIQVEHAHQPGFQTVINEDGSVGFTLIPPDPRRARIAELLEIPRSNWTATQRAELLELLARDITS